MSNENGNTEVREATSSEIERLRAIEAAVFEVFARMSVSPSEAMTVATAIACRLAISSDNLGREKFLASIAESFDFYTRADTRDAN